VHITKLRIDGQFFLLEDDQDIAALKKEIVDAANGRARFIEFTSVGHGQVSVLMNPTFPARFEVQERTEEEMAEWERNPPSIDVDFDSYTHH
jgi:hypothetical protein